MGGLGGELASPLGGDTISDEDNNITKLMKLWLSGVQNVEAVLQQLYSERGIETAVGAQLDVLGRIVGQGRAGLADEVYRLYIRAKISANRSKGTLTDVIRVADLIVNDEAAHLLVTQTGFASFKVVVEDIIIDDHDVIEALIRFMRVTAAAGVRPLVTTWPLDDDDMFVLGGSAGTGAGAVGKGLGNTLDAADGGGLASVRD